MNTAQAHKSTNDINLPEEDINLKIRKVAISNSEFDSIKGHKEFVLEASFGPDIRFKGELLAEQEGTTYGYNESKITLKIFKTVGGNFIVSRKKLLIDSDKDPLHEVQVCETEEEVIEFFGYRWMSKNLYEEAGISHVLNIK